MASVPKNSKFHFTHPNHPLVYHSDDQDYICDGCKTSGSGSRFRCHPCNFDLHEYCANCPEKLSSSIHRRHLLTLVLRKPDGARVNERICDICRDPVDGLFYRCKDCDFDTHPLCTQLPKEISHVADNQHPLKLQKLPSAGSCAVCKTDCSSLWVYGCEICRVNIHLDCLFQPYGSPPVATQWRGSPVPPPSQERSGGTTSRGIRPPWAAGQPPPFPGGEVQWNGRYSDGAFSYGFDDKPNPPPWAAGPPPPFPGGGVPWNGGYSGGAFPYGFDAEPNPYNNFGMGGHSGTFGYAAPYGVPDYHFGYPGNYYGFGNHGSVHSNVNHQGSQAVNAYPPPPSSSGNGGKRRKSMFALVGRLTLGVMSSVIFGFPIGV